MGYPRKLAAIEKAAYTLSYPGHSNYLGLPFATGLPGIKEYIQPDRTYPYTMAGIGRDVSDAPHQKPFPDLSGKLCSSMPAS